MKRRRLATRLGLDGNSLRRRTDRIAAYGTVGLLVVLLVAGPIWPSSPGTGPTGGGSSQRQDQRSSQRYGPPCAPKAPLDPGSFDASGSWTPARWTPPGGTRGTA